MDGSVDLTDSRGLKAGCEEGDIAVGADGDAFEPGWLGGWNRV